MYDNDIDYSVYQNMTSFSWICFGCGFANFDSSIFNTRSITTSNSYSALFDLDESPIENQGETPQTSTPKKQNDPNTRKMPSIENCKQSLKGIIINCNGLKSVVKQAIFAQP